MKKLSIILKIKEKGKKVRLVRLATDSLVTKHLWSHQINKQKSKWTWYVSSAFLGKRVKVKWSPYLHKFQFKEIEEKIVTHHTAHKGDSGVK